MDLHHVTGLDHRHRRGRGHEAEPAVAYRVPGDRSDDPAGAGAELLGLGDGDALVRRRVLYADDEPTQIANSYYPWSLAEKCPALLQVDVGCGGSYARLAEIGRGPVRFTEDIDVRQPSEAEQRTLGLEPTQPVFEIHHVAYASDGDPVEVCVHVMPGHLWTLCYSWDDTAEDRSA